MPTGQNQENPITSGVDAATTCSATTPKEESSASEVELRQDATGSLSDRLALRRARRNRKTRAPLRFDNRAASKHKGLACAVRAIQAHISRIEAVCRVLPITKIVIEPHPSTFRRSRILSRKARTITGGQSDWNVREYVLFRDGHVCQAAKADRKI
ncbi:MAG: RRXRR domain-containing protein [Duodenibacillus massiliensis]